MLITACSSAEACRVFGRRYRQVVKGWEASVRGPDRAANRRYAAPSVSELIFEALTGSRTNWSGAALSTFYSAVRQALVVAIVIRALATGSGLAGFAWWLYRRWGGGAAAIGEL